MMSALIHRLYDFFAYHPSSFGQHDVFYGSDVLREDARIDSATSDF